VRNEKIVALFINEDSNEEQAVYDYLCQIPFVSIAGHTSSIKEVVPLIEKTQPDVVLIDISCPDRDGVGLVKKLDRMNLHPHFIFISAQAEHAVDAFRCHAFDFLLKPFQASDLRKALRRALQHKLNQYNTTAMEIVKMNQDNRLRFNDRSGYLMIHRSNILYITADCNYTELHLKNCDVEALSLNIGEIEKTLPFPHFFRISRSAIINLEYLARVNTKDKYCLLDCSGEMVKLSISAKRLKLLDNFIR